MKKFKIKKAQYQKIKMNVHTDRETNILNEIFLNAAPFIINIWDDTPKHIDTNEQSLKIFGLESKAQFIECFHDLSPECQPCGTPSKEMAVEYVNQAFQNGHVQFEWMHQTLLGEPLPTEITLVRYTRKGKNYLVAYGVDLRPVKAAIEKERESHKIIQAIMDSSPVVINLWDNEGRLLSTSEHALKLHNVASREEYIRRFGDFSPERQPNGLVSKDMIPNLLNKAYSEGYARFDWMHCTSDGYLIPTEITLMRFEIQGKPMIVGYTTDLTLVKKAMRREREVEQRLQEQEFNERIKLVFDAAPLSVTIYDENFNFIDCNIRNSHMFGFVNKDDIIAVYKENFPVLSPQFQPCGKSSVEKAQEITEQTLEKGYLQFEWMHHDRFNEPLPTEVTLVRVIYRDTYQILSFVRDLRQIKAAQEMEREAEENERNARKALEHREKLLNTLNVASEILLTADAGDTLAALMKGMEIVGRCLDLDRVQIWRNEEVDGRLHFVMRYEWLSEYGKTKEVVPNGLSVPYDNVPGWYDMFLSGCCINGPISSLTPFEASFLGFYEMVSIVCLPLFMNGEFIGFFSVDDCQYERTYTKDEMDMFASAGLMFTNVFNRNLQAEMLEAAKKTAILAEVAEESNKAKSRFLARMSHEIRTPISAVMGISEIHLQNRGLHPAIEEAFVKIYNSSNTLLTLVNDILDLSKIEADKMELMMEPYEVASMVSDVGHLHLAYMSNKNIIFNILVDENLPKILVGDVVRIKQIISNLLSNAFKYTEHGVVEFALHYNTAQLVLTIRDTGMGMTPEQVSGMKSDYTRYHEKGSNFISGTGLGMPIVYSLIQMMDARIHIESEIGNGTTITVKIPQESMGSTLLGKETVLELQQFKANPNEKRFDFTPEPMPYGSVLVVDDVDANLYVARGLLAFYSLSIELCKSGPEAIQKVEQGKTYDIIFMDQMMPEMDGAETMRALRNLGYTQPIIALTANALIGQAETFINMGFDGFISKPIQTKYLNTMLTKHIRDKHPLDAVETARAVVINNTNPALDINQYQSNADMVNMLRVDFAKRHKKTFQDITKAINAGDIKTAHFETHTLKGLAGLIFEKNLTNIANSIEYALKNKQIPTTEQLNTLEQELKHVLESINSQQQPIPIQGNGFDKARALDLLEKVKPYLESFNAQSVDFLDALNAVPETAILRKQIEDFDFGPALQSLLTLQSLLDE